MIQVGAIFSIHRREDDLTFKIADGGDSQQCRRILASVKSRPARFFDAFRAEVQRIVPFTAATEKDRP